MPNAVLAIDYRRHRYYVSFVRAHTRNGRRSTGRPAATMQRFVLWCVRSTKPPGQGIDRLGDQDRSHALPMGNSRRSFNHPTLQRRRSVRAHDLSAELDVLRHRRLRVPELVRDHPRREPRLVQDRRGCLPEHVRRDPREPVRPASVPKISHRVRPITQPPRLSATTGPSSAESLARRSRGNVGTHDGNGNVRSPAAVVVDDGRSPLPFTLITV